MVWECLIFLRMCSGIGLYLVFDFDFDGKGEDDVLGRWGSGFFLGCFYDEF